jgi:arachidonate 5-lipoxygenase
MHPNHPYKNLVFEGGGAKGGIYPGAISSLEEMGILPYIDRFCGTSAGALVAMLLALGMGSAELQRFFDENDMEAVVTPDHVAPQSGNDWAWALSTLGLHPLIKCFQSIGRMNNDFGLHRGDRLLGWIQDVIEEKVGPSGREMTFADLYTWYGVELCIVVTNVNHAKSEYLHVKTTPNMSLALAARTSMSLPGLIVPPSMAIDPSGKPNYFADGAILNNFPIEAFDGWYLDMGMGKSMIASLSLDTDQGKRLTQYEAYMRRFDGINPQTIGFKVASATDGEVYQFAANEAQELRYGKAVEYEVRSNPVAALPDPPTALSAPYTPKRLQLEADYKAANALTESVRYFYSILNKVWTKNGRQSALDLSTLKKEIAEAEKKRKQNRVGIATLLAEFGFDTVEEMFDEFDVNSDGMISAAEVEYFFQSHHFSRTANLIGIEPSPVSSFGGYLGALVNGLSLAPTVVKLCPEHLERACILNAEYVQTTTFTLEDGDRDFMYRKGKATAKMWLMMRELCRHHHRRRRRHHLRAEASPAGPGATRAGKRLASKKVRK